MVDINELTKLLEEEETLKKDLPSQPDKRENKEVLKFIKDLDVRKGPIKVPTFVIYYNYYLWSKPQWRKTWKKEEFFRTFKKHFELKRTGNQRYYLINDTLDLSIETYEEAKKYAQKKKRK